MNRDLSDLDLVAFIVDGAGLGEDTCVLALGIDIHGVKHLLALGGDVQSYVEELRTRIEAGPSRHGHPRPAPANRHSSYATVTSSLLIIRLGRPAMA